VYYSYLSMLCNPNKRRLHGFRPDICTDQSPAALAPVSLWARKWVQPTSLLRFLSPGTCLERVVTWTFRTGCWVLRRPRVSTTAVRSESALPFPKWLSPWGILARNTPSEHCTFLRCWRWAGAQRCLARLQWMTHRIKQNERRRSHFI